MRTAMAAVFGPLAPQARTFYSGKTDRQIMLDTFPDLTPDAVVARLDTFRAAYIAAFEERHADFVARTRAMPGVLDVIHSLDGTIMQAPLTGNIAAIAERKLNLLGLLPYLNTDAGAYGDDHHDRAALPPIAADRAARILGQPIAGHEIIIVGDTPHDIRCGKAHGARTVAVATGPYSLDDLRAHEPDALLADFGDVAAGRAAVLGS
jgi:phosphoglycolate phosphatase-like HAD superfamily hydrolase